MNFFEHAISKVITARQAEADRYVQDYMSDRGFDAMFDLSQDPRG